MRGEKHSTPRENFVGTHRVRPRGSDCCLCRRSSREQNVKRSWLRRLKEAVMIQNPFEAFAALDPRTVAGSCSNGGGKSMLQRAGRAGPPSPD